MSFFKMMATEITSHEHAEKTTDEKPRMRVMTRRGGVDRQEDNNEFLASEVVRRMAVELEAFCPPPRGYWGELLRKVGDIAVLAVRKLVSLYFTPFEYMKDFVARATKLVRLLLEEAWHRTLWNTEDPKRRVALCNLVCQMRQLEEDSLPNAVRERGWWRSFNEKHVRYVAEKVREGTCWMGDLPSFKMVMQNEDMCHEIYSLIDVRVMPDRMHLRQRDVRHFHAHHGLELAEDEDVPGKVEHGVFECVFPESYQ